MTNDKDELIRQGLQCELDMARTGNNGHAAIEVESLLLECEEDARADQRFAAWLDRDR